MQVHKNNIHKQGKSIEGSLNSTQIQQFKNNSHFVFVKEY